LRRNRSTRSLWDPNYVDESWIGDKVDLIPRMKSWVASYYPGLKTGITEYNWGAENHINGATAQADVYGIFGRQGLDFGTRWTTPAASTPTYKAMKLYRNYDGAGHGFGDVSVAATAPNPDNVSAFAATRSGDGALTVMVIAKVLTGTTPVAVHLGNFVGSGAVQAWQLTSSNAITRLPDLAIATGTVNTTVPAQSITLLIINPGGEIPNRLAGNLSRASRLQPAIVQLTWSGGATRVDVYRDGVLRVNVANTGKYSEKAGSNPASGYIVCDADTTRCSSSVMAIPGGNARPPVPPKRIDVMHGKKNLLD